MKSCFPSELYDSPCTCVRVTPDCAIANKGTSASSNTAHARGKAFSLLMPNSSYSSCGIKTSAIFRELLFDVGGRNGAGHARAVLEHHRGRGKNPVPFGELLQGLDRVLAVRRCIQIRPSEDGVGPRLGTVLGAPNADGFS